MLRALLGLSLYYIVLGQDGKFFCVFCSLNLKVKLPKDSAWLYLCKGQYMVYLSICNLVFFKNTTFFNKLFLLSFKILKLKFEF